MTHYFDKAIQAVSDIDAQSDEEFLKELQVIERRIVDDVAMCTGDREFPNHLRQAIMKVVANSQARVDRAPFGPTPGLKISLATRSSQLLSELHRAFHLVAAAKIKTRFGTLTDDPSANVKARDTHDGEEVS